MKKIIALIISMFLLPVVAFAGYDYKIGTKNYEANGSRNSELNYRYDYFINATDFSNSKTVTILNENNRTIYLMSNVNNSNITVDLNGHSNVKLYFMSPRKNTQPDANGTITDESDCTKQTSWTIINSDKNNPVSNITLTAENPRCTIGGNSVYVASAAEVKMTDDVNNIKYSQFDLTKINFKSTGIESFICSNCFYDGNPLVGATEEKFETIKSVTLNGGSYSGMLFTNKTDLHINGGTYDGVKINNLGTGSISINGTPKFTASTVDGEKIFIDHKSTGTISITGGSYKLYDNLFFKSESGSGDVTIQDVTVNGQCTLFNNANFTGNATINRGSFKMTENTDSSCYGDTRNRALFSNSGTMTISGGRFETDGKLFINNNILTINDGSKLVSTTQGAAFSSSGSKQVIVNINGGEIIAQEAKSATFTTLVLGKRNATESDPSPVLDLRSVLSTTFGTGTSEKSDFFFYKGTMYVKEKPLDPNKFAIRNPEQDSGIKIQYKKSKDGSAYMATLVPADTPDPVENDLVLGDWNKDTKFNMEDIAMYRRYISDANSTVTIGSEQKTYAQLDSNHQDYLDFNDDKTVNLVDLVLARNWLAKKGI